MDVRTLCLAALSVTLPSNTPQAGAILFTDRAAWRAAAGGGVGDIEDNLDAGTLTRTAVTITDDLSGTIAAFPNSNPVNAIDGSGYLRLFLDNSGRFVTFTFASPITAFGYDLNPHSLTVGTTIAYAINGVASGSYTLPATDVTEFRGVVSDSSFTTFTLTTPDADTRHGMDNLEAFTSVPEVGYTAFTAAVGLAGFGTYQRLRRLRAGSRAMLSCSWSGDVRLDREPSENGIERGFMRERRTLTKAKEPVIYRAPTGLPRPWDWLVERRCWLRTS